MALGVAVVGIHTHHGHRGYRLTRQLQTIAELQAQAPGQLLTEHDGATAGQLFPGTCAVFQ
ncbi:hypothetical protein D3C72_1903180 [compost metagenome]